MENLTPELERRLQVEESWARRIVFEDLMNASRHQRFLERKSLFYRCSVIAVDSKTVAQVPAFSRIEDVPLSKTGLFSPLTINKVAVSAIALACSLIALSACGVMQRILSQ
jgi:hypothetical protein